MPSGVEATMAMPLRAGAITYPSACISEVSCNEAEESTLYRSGVLLRRSALSLPDALLAIPRADSSLRRSAAANVSSEPQPEQAMLTPPERGIVLAACISRGWGIRVCAVARVAESAAARQEDRKIREPIMHSKLNDSDPSGKSPNALNH